MTMQSWPSPLLVRREAERIYAPDPLPRLQSLQAILADFDFAHQSDIETVQASSVDEGVKRAVIAVMTERHCKRREPYLRQITTLEKRIQAVAA